jgi:hypothetical protein
MGHGVKFTSPRCHVGSRASSHIYSSSADVPLSSTTNTFSSSVQNQIPSFVCVVFVSLAGPKGINTKTHVGRFKTSTREAHVCRASVSLWISKYNRLTRMSLLLSLIIYLTPAAGPSPNTITLLLFKKIHLQ